MLFPRNLKTPILKSADNSRLVFVNGARQTGKSTLMRGLFPGDETHEYVTMDNMTALKAARESPESFLSQLPPRTIINEVQRAPQLFLPLKELVDREKTPGRFLLTGSAGVLTLPQLSDSLAGRMQIHTLWTLSQGELKGLQECFVDMLFGDEPLPGKTADSSARQLAQICATGGFPDVVTTADQDVRDDWFSGYLTTILERDVRELSNIEALTAMPDLLRLIATRSGGLLNLADLSRSLELPYSTLKRYLTLLEAVFLVITLPAWSLNLGNRLVKSAKMFLADTGLLCHLVGASDSTLENDRALFGLVLENFVVMELIKQIGWSKSRPRLYHYRTVKGNEVDFVLQTRSGKIIGIECKSKSNVGADAFKGLRHLQEAAGKNFKRGIVLYTGSASVDFADNLHALPVSALWDSTNTPAPPLVVP